MMQPGNAIVIDAAITPLPAAPLHVLELWSNPKAAAVRVKKALGFALPETGKAASKGSTTLIRFEPTVWLVEGDLAGLEAALGDDGALTAIGGGVVRVQLSGPEWRTLLMEGGVFDAESPAFGPGCSAATVIDHVAVRLHVTAADSCTAYVPASHAHDMIDFWQIAASVPAV